MKNTILALIATYSLSSLAADSQTHAFLTLLTAATVVSEKPQQVIAADNYQQKIPATKQALKAKQPQKYNNPNYRNKNNRINQPRK